MKQLQKIHFLFLILAIFSSCEKTIELKVKDQPQKLVVDASIENGQFPVVALSTSLNYFSTISAEELANSFVHDAVITISDGTKTSQLKEYAYHDTGGFTLYYYTADSSNLISAVIGDFNKQYQLNIKTKDAQEYAATTTIPMLTKTCDSIWWKQAPNTDDTSLCIMFGKFTDPKGFGNYVRYFTQRNSG